MKKTEIKIRVQPYEKKIIYDAKEKGKYIDTGTLATIGEIVLSNLI
jgi:hypothetical protein